MATSARQDTQAADATRRLAALRGNCMGASVLLIIQFGLGMGINLYVTLPAHKAFFSTVFGSAAVAVHVIVALALLGAVIGAVVRAIRCGRAIVPVSAGLAAVVVAWIGGVSFAGSQSGGASLAMALATAVAMFCYLVAIFSLR
jgi:hypothetical protein